MTYERAIATLEYPDYVYVLGTIASMSGLSFEVLIDDALAGITSVSQLTASVNNRVSSLIKDFEDAKWRYLKFQSYSWDNIAQTARSERERTALLDQS